MITQPFDFDTVADAAPIDTGVPYDPSVTIMAGAQLHYKTAPCIIEALEQRVRGGLFGYTESDTPHYLSAVHHWMHDIRNFPIERDWIVPSYGTLQAVSASIRMLTDHGDGVIVQPPAYVLYDRVISRTGRMRVDNPLLLSNGRYAMDLNHLENLMRSPRNKLMLLCNPHNPIMDIWDEQTLRDVASLAARYSVTVIADEIFAEQVFPGHQVTPYASIPEAAGRSIICTSIGKAFNFTGVSHANVIIPDDALRARYIAQRNEDHYGSLSPFMYTAVTAAYTEAGKAWIDALIAHTAPRIEQIRTLFQDQLPSASICHHTAGTLLWIDFTKLGVSEDMLHRMLRAAGVVMDVGSKYGQNGELFSRMQIGMPDSELFPAIERMMGALGTHQNM